MARLSKLTLAMGLAMISNQALASTTLTYLVGRHGLAPYLEGSPAGELSTINLAVLGQLMTLDEGYNVRPGLLEEAHYDYSRDLFVLRLRGGLRFHNGRLATADDLEFSLTRGFFSPNHSFYRTYIGNIDGIDEAVGKPYTPGLVKGVRVVGPLTVEVKLRAPNPTFLASLVNPYFSLVPREALDQTLLTWKTVPIGVGPYRVAAPGFAHGHVTLEKNSQEQPGPDRLEMYTGDVLPRYDLSEVSAEKISSSSEYFRDEPGAVTTIFFSSLNPLGVNKHFRKAVSLLVDRKRLADGIKGSTPTTQLLPRHFWGRTDRHDEVNIEAARREVAQIPPDLVKRYWHFARFMGSNKYPEMEFLAQELVRQFAAVGLNFSPTETTEKFTSRASAEENPIFVKSRITDYIDPLIMFSSFRKGGHDTYLSPLDDPEYERLFVAASNAKIHDDRISTVRTLSEYVSDHLMCVPLLERRYQIYYDQKRVKSLGEQSRPNTLVIQNIVP